MSGGMFQERKIVSSATTEKLSIYLSHSVVIVRYISQEIHVLQVYTV